MYFITFRLANSLPVEVIQQLQEQLKLERESIRTRVSGVEQANKLYQLDKKYFGQFDAWLDRCVEESPRWLGDEQIARIVADEIHQLDGVRYTLMAY